MRERLPRASRRDYSTHRDDIPRLNASSDWGSCSSESIAWKFYRETLMAEYLCLTLVANAGESEVSFKSRLAAFWTFLIRARPDDYVKVYAEASKFGNVGGRISRQYMVEVDGADALFSDLETNAISVEPVDRDDTYSKYEAASPEWFQIPH